MARLVPVRISSAPVPMADFYREEFLRHRRCLASQREYYSEQAITEADAVGLTGMAFVPTQVLLLLVVGGMALGCLGGFVVARGVK